MTNPEPERIYLDNAATSFPKPEEVYAAVDRYQRDLGAAYGRGASRSAMQTQQLVEQCRHRAAQLLGAPDPRHVVFTLNGTDSLNLALHGLLRAGDHVVITPWEHNSVLRPLRALKESRGVNTTVLPHSPDGRVSLDDVRAAIRSDTRLLVVTHASNVTGVVQPVEEMIRIAKSAGCRVLVDAAQSAGHRPLDHLMKQCGADLVACPGHKGLLGPLGTGLLAITQGTEAVLSPVREGGTGTSSESDEQPTTLPDRYESGNHNVPGLCGLGAALEWLAEQSVERIQQHDLELTRQLLDGLRQCPGVSVFGDVEPGSRVGVVSFSIPGTEPQAVAGILDQHFGIEVRAGLHCAPGSHRALGTFEGGGTVRMSVGPFTTPEEVDRALEAVAQISVSV